MSESVGVAAAEVVAADVVAGVHRTTLTLDEAEIAEGYRDGRQNEPCGDNRSRSYWHGWRNGMMDGKHMKGDHASAVLAKAYCEDQNRPRLASPSPSTGRR